MKSTEPTQAQLAAINSTDMASPFDMVNLIKYRSVADYGADSQENGRLTGREAYNEYAKTVLPKIIELGGQLVYRGACQLQFVGDESQNYDELIVVRYPSRQAYLDLFHSQEYQAAIAHRKAGLEFRVLHLSSPMMDIPPRA